MKKLRRAGVLLAATGILSGCANHLTRLATNQSDGILNPDPIGTIDKTKKEQIPYVFMTGSGMPPAELDETVINATNKAMDAAIAASEAQTQYDQASKTADELTSKATDLQKKADGSKITKDRDDAEAAQREANEAKKVKIDKERKKETAYTNKNQAEMQKELAEAKYYSNFIDQKIGIISPNAAFFKLQYLSSRDYSDPKAAQDYLKAGISISNDMCEQWFQQLGVASVTLRQSSDTLSAIGSLTTVILGAVEAPSKSLTLAGGLFGVGKQSLDSVAANYILTPDLAEVRRSLYNYRTIYANSILETTNEYDFFSARAALTSYDNTCSQLGVKTFVTAQISKEQSNPAINLEDTALKKFAKKYADIFFTKAKLTEATIVPFYTFAFLQDVAKEDQKTALRSALEPFLTNGAVDYKPGKSDTVFLAELQSEGLLALVDSRARQFLQTLKPKVASDPTSAEGDVSPPSALSTPTHEPVLPTAADTTSVPSSSSLNAVEPEPTPAQIPQIPAQ